MGGLAVAAAVIAVLAWLVLPAIYRDELRKRREWRPAGYSAEHGPDWWSRPLPSIALHQNVRVIDAPPAAELVSMVDPRIVRTSRHLSAPVVKRKAVERIRRIEKRRPRVRGAA